MPRYQAFLNGIRPMLKLDCIASGGMVSKP